MKERERERERRKGRGVVCVESMRACMQKLKIKDENEIPIKKIEGIYPV